MSPEPPKHATSLSSACNELLRRLPNHEYGIPALRPHTRPEKSLPDLENAYCATNARLAARLDELVYCDRKKQLHDLLRAEINALFLEIVAGEPFVSLVDAVDPLALADLEDPLALADLEKFLVNQQKLKQSLLKEFLPIALPVLRAIHVDNASLTASELLVLNKVKKLYSRYNDHRAKTRTLVAAYEQSVDALEERLRLTADIEQLLCVLLRPNVARLKTLGKEHKQAQKRRDLAIKRYQDVQLKLRRDLAALERPRRAVSVLADLLPCLVLCHPVNWYNDVLLREIMTTCQSAGEAVTMWSSLESECLSGSNQPEGRKTAIEEEMNREDENGTRKETSGNG